MTPLVFASLNGTLALDTGGTATGVGALRYRPGKWAGTQAAFVEEGTTNAITNPAFTVDTSGWSPANGAASIARSTVYGRSGPASCLVTVTGAGQTLLYNGYVAGTTGQVWTASSYVRGPVGDLADQRISEFTAAQGFLTESQGADVALLDAWQRAVYTRILSNASTALISTRVRAASAVAYQFYATDVQLEQKDHATSFCPEADGSGNLLPGYAWTGAANASSSTRAATTLTIPYSGTAGSLSLLYSEDDGATWRYLYRVAPVAGAIGTYGQIADDGTKLTITSSRALRVGPLRLDAAPLTQAQQDTLSGATEPWTADMLDTGRTVIVRTPNGLWLARRGKQRTFVPLKRP